MNKFYLVEYDSGDKALFKTRQEAMLGAIKAYIREVKNWSNFDVSHCLCDLGSLFDNGYITEFCWIEEIELEESI